MKKVGIAIVGKLEKKKKARMIRKPLNIQIESVEHNSRKVVTLAFSYAKGSVPPNARWCLCTLNGQPEPDVKDLTVIDLMRTAVVAKSHRHCKMWLEVYYRTGKLYSRSKVVEVVAQPTKIADVLNRFLHNAWIRIKRTFGRTNE